MVALLSPGAGLHELKAQATDRVRREALCTLAAASGTLIDTAAGRAFATAASIEHGSTSPQTVGSPHAHKLGAIAHKLGAVAPLPSAKLYTKFADPAAGWHRVARVGFALADRHHDGRITRAEMRAMLETSGLRCDGAFVESIFVMFDKNRSGTIELDEFAQLLPLLRHYAALDTHPRSGKLLGTAETPASSLRSPLKPMAKLTKPATEQVPQESVSVSANFTVGGRGPALNRASTPRVQRSTAELQAKIATEVADEQVAARVAEKAATSWIVNGSRHYQDLKTLSAEIDHANRMAGLSLSTYPMEYPPRTWQVASRTRITPRLSGQLSKPTGAASLPKSTPRRDGDSRQHPTELGLPPTSPAPVRPEVLSQKDNRERVLSPSADTAARFLGARHSMSTTLASPGAQRQHLATAAAIDARQRVEAIDKLGTNSLHWQ